MDGRGRAMDNVFIERLWRTVKYEEIYLKDYEAAWEAEDSLAAYFRFYCHAGSIRHSITRHPRQSIRPAAKAAWAEHDENHQEVARNKRGESQDNPTRGCAPAAARDL